MRGAQPTPIRGGWAPGQDYADGSARRFQDRMVRERGAAGGAHAHDGRLESAACKASTAPWSRLGRGSVAPEMRSDPGSAGHAPRVGSRFCRSGALSLSPTTSRRRFGAKEVILAIPTSSPARPP